MFLLNWFSCSSPIISKQGYEIRSIMKGKQLIIFSQTYETNNSQKQSIITQVIKVIKSDYSQLVKQLQVNNQLWEDDLFPASNKSIGNIENVRCHKWMRISELLNNPVLFDSIIEPQDVIQGQLGDCYFLAALSALAEKPKRIKDIFGNQTYNPKGIYKIKFRVKGIVEEIIVDDYLPVDNRGEAIFCKPNKNQFWVTILEKAWAKIHESYSNIIGGNSQQVLKAITLAPCENLRYSQESKQSIWKTIVQNSLLDRPCCCSTIGHQIDEKQIGLVSGHAYTLLDAVELRKKKGNKVRIMKLRNPWGQVQWKGEGNENDTIFWNGIEDCEQKTNFLKNMSRNDDGIFYMTFTDFPKYFDEINLCYLQQYGNYNYQNFIPHPKHGSYWQIQVTKQGDYYIQIHQKSSRFNRIQTFQLCRGTILLFRSIAKDKGSFQWVNGILSKYRQDITLKVKLQPGKYVVFTKFDLPITSKSKVPSMSSISVYSKHFIAISLLDRIQYGTTLKLALLNHYRNNEKQSIYLNNNTMWRSRKLFFNQGGYAYQAFNVSKDSNYLLTVTFNQEELNKQHFKLKKPFKGKGKITLTIKPGEEEIVICRVINEDFRNILFSPTIQYEITKIS